MVPPIHRWIAVPTALLIPIAVIIKLAGNPDAIAFWEKWDKLPSIFMLLWQSQAHIYICCHILQKRSESKKYSSQDTNRQLSRKNQMGSCNENKWEITAQQNRICSGSCHRRDAVFAGGRVLLGILPDYYIIDWLPVYNS